MNKLQKKQFEILCEVDRICEKHKLEYFLSSGTMLGAIRHKGFIPWDDDLDLEMPRKDYEKFKKIALKEMKKEYFYQDMSTDSGYGQIFAKIRINNTKYIENIAKKSKAHCGIYIDIFPVDNYSNKDKLALKKVIFLRMLLLLKKKYIIECDSFFKKIELFLLKIIKNFVSVKFLTKTIEKIISKNDDINSEYVACYGYSNFDKIRQLKKWFSKREKYDFEGKKFWGTKYYDEYLKYQYNDYMKLPPVEKRRNHGIIEVEYDD